MELKQLAPLDAYLTADRWIESEHPAIKTIASRFRSPEEAYCFVRDEIRHSYDIRASAVTATASEVLSTGHGICYAKAHLLAAILRAMGIPSGIAYQRLVLFDDPADGYSLHAMNTVYLSEEGHWIRLDARGNKSGVNATYSTTEEHLAFSIRPELGECDYPWNFAAPPLPIQKFYAQDGNITELYSRCLPDALASEPVTLRQAIPEDAEAIHQLTLDAYLEYQSTEAPSSVFAERAETLQERMTTHQVQAIVAEQEGNIVGSVRYQLDDEQLYFFRLAVHPDARQQGIATMLLDHLETIARSAQSPRLICKVRMTETRNVNIYQQRGFAEFERVNVRRGTTDVPTGSMEKRLNYEGMK